jgi:hypothetical protein
MDAARNNALWCDAVCRAQGIETAFTGTVWAALRRSPPYYPDAVTLAPGATPGEVLRDIDTSAGCSVKDSFATLDLSAHGFRVLFDAEWIRRDAAEAPAGDPQWRTVRDPADFGLWEVGEVFRPALLREPGVTFLQGPDGGVIANRTGDVVGLSNLVIHGDTDKAWAGAVQAIAGHHPGLPIVGYESGDDLAAAERAGFTRTGPLRIWIKD